MIRLDQALEGEAPLPEAFWIGRLCEEFPAYGPAEAERAWRAAPVGWLEEIIEARHYAAAKGMYDRAARPEDLPKDDPLLQVVQEIAYERAGARLKAARAKRQGGAGG